MAGDIGEHIKHSRLTRDGQQRQREYAADPLFPMMCKFRRIQIRYQNSIQLRLNRLEYLSALPSSDNRSRWSEERMQMPLQSDNRKQRRRGVEPSSRDFAYHGYLNMESFGN